MSKYSKEFKEEALKLSDEIGVKKTALQLGLQYYTLADWRKARKYAKKHTVVLTENEAHAKICELERENTERLGNLDIFLFPNGLSVMPVEELKQFQKFWVNFDCTFIDISNYYFFVNFI